jgi:hypothetical protein
MSTGANTGVRGHIEVTLRYADRKGGNQIANIEKMTEAEPIASSNPPTISHFLVEFFNNIGQDLSLGPSNRRPDSGQSRPGIAYLLATLPDRRFHTAHAYAADSHDRFEHTVDHS